MMTQLTCDNIHLQHSTTDIFNQCDIMSHDNEIEGSANISLMYVYACPNMFLTKQDKNTHVSYKPHFWNWLCALRLVFVAVFLFSHCVFPPPSVSTSAGLDSVPGEVTHTFNLWEVWAIAILPGGFCYGFPLPLSIWHGNTKRCAKGSPVPKT